MSREKDLDYEDFVEKKKKKGPFLTSYIYRKVNEMSESRNGKLNTLEIVFIIVLLGSTGY